LILVDASGLLAVVNDRDPAHDAATRAFEADAGPYILSPFVLAEVDYLVTSRVGVAAELSLLGDVAAGAYMVPPVGNDHVARARDVVSQYEDIAIGLADASIVVLAEEFGTNRVLTLDERHFRALRTRSGDAFMLLPADC
jgi:uncharacterized protein